MQESVIHHAACSGSQLKSGYNNSYFKVHWLARPPFLFFPGIRVNQSHLFFLEYAADDDGRLTGRDQPMPLPETETHSET